MIYEVVCPNPVVGELGAEKRMPAVKSDKSSRSPSVAVVVESDMVTCQCGTFYTQFGHHVYCGKCLKFYSRWEMGVEVDVEKALLIALYKLHRAGKKELKERLYGGRGEGKKSKAKVGMYHHKYMDALRMVKTIRDDTRIPRVAK